MPMLVRHEFVGSKLTLWFLFVLPLLLPLGIVYLLEGTATVRHEMEDPEAFLAEFRGNPPRGES